MKKNIFLSIICLIAPLTLKTNGQAQVDPPPPWVLNVQVANGEELKIVTPKSDQEARKDASPNAIILNHNNDNSSAFRDFVRDVRDSAVYGVSHTVRHLPLEAASFYSAMGALAVYDCAIKVKSNPMACSEFGQTLEDPISHLSFFIFMSTNHSVSYFLNTGGRPFIPRATRDYVDRVAGGKVRWPFPFIPRAAIGYIGMAAGSFVSSIAAELLTDTDVQYIRKNFFKGNKTDIDKDRLALAYSNAYDKFVPTETELISRHAPHLISLTLAAFLSSATQSILSFANNNILSKTENLNDKLRRAPIKLIKRNGIYHPTKRTMTKRIFLPVLKLTVKTGKWLTLFSFSNPIIGFTLRVGHIVIFFAWNDILHPPIQKAWDLRKYNEKMNDEKISILEHLTAGYEKRSITQELNNVAHANLLTNIFSFAFNFLSLNQRDRLRERTHIQDNLIALLNTSSDQVSLQYADVDNQYFPEILLDVPHLTEEIETDLFVGETTKARGDVLLEKILQFNVYAQDYRNTLLREFDEAKYRWESFFQPAISWQNTTYNFYRHIIETQKQLSFETEPRTPVHTRPPHQLSNDPTAKAYYYQNFFPDQNTKSKGMLDALHFSSRSLNESNNIFTQRLLDESRVLRFGVQPNIVHQLSNPDLQWLHERLSNEHTLLTSEPTENHLSLVSLLNKGFDISQMYDFEDFDFQVRLETLLNEKPHLKLNPDILYTKSTQEINEFMEFLKSQPEGIASYYIHLANQGWDWNQLYTFNIDDIIVQYNTLIANQIAEEDISQKTIVQNGAMYFDPSNSQGSRHYGIIYYSTVEKLLISMVCGESIEEIDLVQRSAFGLGNLEFNAPRIWENKPALCDQIETVHHAFLVRENNQDIYYYNLLDYVSKNIGDQLTLEDFENFWRSQVIPTVEPILSQYMERKTNVLGEDISNIYNDTSYLIQHQHGRYSNNFHSTGAIPNTKTAKGIWQFEKDMTDYHLNLLIALLPKQDSFLNPFRNYIDCIRQLSEYPGYRFEEIIHASASCQGEDSTWADQIENVLQVNNIVKTLNDDPIMILKAHAEILEHLTTAMHAYIQERLPNDQNTVILLGLVNNILFQIKKSILHSSEIDIHINALTST